MNDGTEPIADVELLYRRIPAAWYDLTTGIIGELAFAPNKDRDTTGLSVSRAKYKTVEQAALRQSGKKYFVAVLIAGELRRAQPAIQIVPQPHLPDGYDASHAELPDLTAGNRKDNDTLVRQELLATPPCLLRVDGPFFTP